MRREADRFGFNNLIAAGYDPSAMGQMFENMAKIRKLAGDNPPEFLLTHPVTSSRVSDALNAADQIEFSGGKKNTINFEFVKGRLKARYPPPLLKPQLDSLSSYRRNPNQ